MTRRERFWMWLAWRLPRSLVYWATARCAAHATTGQYENTIMPGVTIIEMLERWRK